MKPPFNQSPFDFPTWISQAMLSLVKKTIETLAQTNHTYSHAFYITFITKDKKALVPKELLGQFPEVMTIVLENQFSNLTYDKNGFGVELSFNGVLQKLYIPFNAIINFSDKLSHINITLDYNANVSKHKTFKKTSLQQEISSTSKKHSSKKKIDDNVIVFPKLPE